MTKTGDRASLLRQLGKERVVSMYTRMLEIREFEDHIKTLFLQGKMPGTVHQYIGQEACAVGVCEALSKGDVIASTHRPHGHAIAKGIPMKEIAAELYGKVTGCCKGKGGSMHVGDLDRGMLPAIAIVGGNIPIVVGVALSFKMRNQPQVAISFFGDGATNEGTFHEGLNAASIYNLPVVFVCENNLYAASTSVKLTMKVQNVADRAVAYGMPSDIADGMDVFDVYARAKKLIDAARDGGGPALLELKTFRLVGHSRRDPNNYMSAEEKEYWKKRDPIPATAKELVAAGIVKEKEIEDLKKDVVERVDEAIRFGQDSPEPVAEDLFGDLYVSMKVPE